MPILLLGGGPGTQDVDIGTIDGATPLIGPSFIGAPSDQILDLGTIDGATPLAGISVTLADQPIDPFRPALYAELWDNGVKVSDLTTQSGVRFQDPFNDVGSGNLTIQLDDPDQALLTVGKEVYCYLWGTLVYTWEILQQPRIVRLDAGEESVFVKNAVGQGRAILADKARVYAPKGLENPINAQHRIYSFASIDFPNGSTWYPATQGYRADELDPLRFSIIEYTWEADVGPDTVELVDVPAPVGWPVPEAYWIWGAVDRNPPGKNYFRRSFTLTGETNVGIFVTGDNYYTLYLDGTPILGENEFMHCWQEYKRVDMTLPAGYYTLAAMVINAEWPPGLNNPGGFICAVCELDRDAEIVSNIVVSDGSWHALGYPVPDPGWTAGQIVLDAMEEAVARGGTLDGFFVDFTAINDSEGNPWPIIDGFSITVGNSILSILKGLVDEGHVDWRIKPGGKLLQMFIQTTIADNTVSYPITGDVDTQALMSLQHIPQIEPTNRYLVKWTSGYFQIDDVVSQGVWGTYEGFMTIDSPSLADATSQAAVQLELNANPVYAVVFDLDPVDIVDHTDAPYFAFGPGQMVQVPGPDGVMTWYQVLAITVAQTELARPTFNIELNARINEQEREEFELIQGVGRGLVGDTKYRNSNMAFSKALGITP